MGVNPVTSILSVSAAETARPQVGRPSASLDTSSRLLRNLLPVLGAPAYLVLNWKLRRALARPYFLRSTTRGSRVRNPACLIAVRSAGS